MLFLTFVPRHRLSLLLGFKNIELVNKVILAKKVGDLLEIHFFVTCKGSQRERDLKVESWKLMGLIFSFYGEKWILNFSPPKFPNN